MFTVIVHIHSLSSQILHMSRFQLYSTWHDERAGSVRESESSCSFTSPAENQYGWCRDYMEYGPNYPRQRGARNVVLAFRSVVRSRYSSKFGKRSRRNAPKQWPPLARSLVAVQSAVRSKVDVHCNCSHSFTFITNPTHV